MGRWLLRAGAQVALAVWVGSLPTYGGLTLPRLHQHFGVAATIPITAVVTRDLNLIGGVALALVWALVLLERREGAVGGRRARMALVALSTAILTFLASLHPVMTRHLATEGLIGFGPMHHAYTIASTVQWFANVGLLLIMAGPREREPRQE